MTAERGNLELLSPGGPVGEQMIRSGHGGGVGDVCPWQLRVSDVTDISQTRDSNVTTGPLL